MWRHRVGKGFDYKGNRLLATPSLRQMEYGGGREIPRRSGAQQGKVFKQVTLLTVVTVAQGQHAEV